MNSVAMLNFNVFNGLTTVSSHKKMRSCMRHALSKFRVPRVTSASTTTTQPKMVDRDFVAYCENQACLWERCKILSTGSIVP